MRLSRLLLQRAINIVSETRRDRQVQECAFLPNSPSNQVIVCMHFKRHTQVVFCQSVNKKAGIYEGES